jgi:hypothetical protein
LSGAPFYFQTESSQILSQKKIPSTESFARMVAEEKGGFLERQEALAHENVQQRGRRCSASL